jgi:hypothetical protein
MASNHFNAYSQATDNTGKDLFVVKTTDGYSFPISTSGFSINFTSSFNKYDTIEITQRRYERIKREQNPAKNESTVKRRVYYDSTTKKYFLVVYRNNNLKSYISQPTFDKFYGELNNQFSSSILQMVQGLQKNDFGEKKQIRQLNKALDSTQNVPKALDSFYSVTDIGNGYHPLFINLKVSNLTIKSLGQFFTNVNQPTIQLEAGGIINSVLKFNNWDSLRHTKGFLGFHEWDLFYSFYASTSCINYLDTVNQARTTYNSNSIGKFMQYGFKTDLNAYQSKYFAVAITTNVWYGLPLDNDKSFQAGNPKQILRNDTLYKTLGQSSGKYGGDINQKLWNARFSIALPIFFDISKAISWLTGIQQTPGSRFYFLPSYAPFISTGTRFTNQVGLSLNLLSKGYGPKNTSIIQAGGLGFDILSNSKAKTGWGSPIFYVSGTINLGSIVSKNGPPAVNKAKPL